MVLLETIPTAATITPVLLLEDSLPASPVLSPLAPSPSDEYMREDSTDSARYDVLDQQSVINNNPKSIYIENNPQSFQKIYNGSNISICGFNCLIMKYANKHNLSYSVIDELLDLFNIICPKPNAIPSSIYKLKKIFKQFENNFSNREFCATCKKFEDDGGCNCGLPKIGRIIAMAVEKPLQAILSGKYLYI